MTKPLDEQIAEVCNALLAIRSLVIPGSTDASPEGRLFVALRESANVCKHCGEQLKLQDGPSKSYLHVTGLQAGKHRCAVEPYGFNAAPVGTPCRADINPCNCTLGDEPRT